MRGGSAAGTTAHCQASNGNCARRGDLGLGVSLPYEYLPSLWGIHCSGHLLQLQGLLWAHRPGASHKTPVKGWTWPWVCQGACGPGGHLRLGVLSPAVGLADGGCPRAPRVQCSALGNTAEWGFGFGAVMQLLGCVSVWEMCCWRCLLGLVSHSLTLWHFTGQELLSHPDSLAPVYCKDL